jgi:hypothetical protein
MTRSEIEDLIQKIGARIEFLKNDRTVWTMAWHGSTYNHGPYLRRLEIKRLKGRLKTLNKKLTRLDNQNQGA